MKRPRDKGEFKREKKVKGKMNRPRDKRRGQGTNEKAKGQKKTQAMKQRN